MTVDVATSLDYDAAVAVISPQDVSASPGAVWNQTRSFHLRCVLKRLLDLAAATLGLILLLPFLALVALAVRMSSPGPVLFWQYRVGRGGKLFRLCKFRTMYAPQGDATGRVPTLVDDPRVTPLGRILRRHSVDELPQLWNVIRGDMSLVGPRAHVPDMMVCGDRYDTVADSYHLRHHVRPGITGLAQIRGFRGPVLDLEHALGRVEADLEYVRTFNLVSDLMILTRTVLLECFEGSGV